MAIGQTPDLSFLREEDSIQLTRQGNITIDPETMATTGPGVFASGDVAAAGPRIIIQAVADGLRAARAIDDYLQRQQTQVQARGLTILLAKGIQVDHSLALLEDQHRLTCPQLYAKIADIICALAGEALLTAGQNDQTS